MGTIIAFINQKGGIGKTTSTINTGGALAVLKKRVLLVDLDQQCDLSFGTGVHRAESTNIIQFLKSKAGIQLQQKADGLHILRGDQNFRSNQYSVSDLSLRLNHFKSHFDFIFMDCPPHPIEKGSASYLGIACADFFVVPLGADDYSVKNANLFLKRIKEHEFQARFLGFLFCNVLVTRKRSNELIRLIQDANPDAVFDTFIRQDATVSKAKAVGKTIFQFQSKSRASNNYMAFAKELLKRIP
ncbi:MAG: ParA family protein [Flavobacteriaceae bacterium]|nr:ParA family protein [Flavobacteriaceae bacterium]MCY4267007.1 ParA family protein [Flavobacteriaceae bacterium]